jgi:hypothetical protein
LTKIDFVVAVEVKEVVVVEVLSNVWQGEWIIEVVQKWEEGLENKKWDW